MAGFDIDVQGIDEIITKLDNINDHVNRGINNVLRESAEPLKEGIEANVNLSDVNHLHAKYDVVISRIRTQGGSRDNNYVQVGYDSTSWRMWFVEFGTIYQAPQHNITNAIESTGNMVLQKQADGLRRLLHGH